MSYNIYAKEREVKKMIEMICKIPEELGWATVGACAVLVVEAVFKIVALFVNGYREAKAEEDKD